MDLVFIISPNADALTSLLPTGFRAASSLDSSNEPPRAVLLDQFDPDQVQDCQLRFPGSPLLVVQPPEASPDQVARIQACLRPGDCLLTSPLRSALSGALGTRLPGQGTRHLLQSGSLAKLYQLGGRELADRVLDAFRTGGAQRLERCRQQWLGGQQTEALEGLRQFHDQAGRVGASTLQDLSAQLEDRIHQGTGSSDLLPMWNELESTFAAVTRMLEQQRRQERTA